MKVPSLTLIPRYLLVGLYSALVLSIVGWVLLASLVPTRDIFRGDIFQFNLTLANFRDLLTVNGGFRNVVNSIIYVVPSCFLIIGISAPAAYAIARMPIRFGNMIVPVLVLCMSIPGIMITLPVFRTVAQMGVQDSRLVLIVLYVATHLPFNTFFLVSFFRSIPDSYHEAAALEGAGDLRIFWEVMFPFVRSAVATLTVFNLIGLWNEYFLALIFANTTALRPVGVWLNATIDAMQVTGNWAGMFAAVVIVAAPTIIAYSFMARWIVSAGAGGGVKG